MSEERLPTQVSSLPFLKLFPVYGHWISITSHSIYEEHHSASSNQDTIEAGEQEQLWFMSVYSLYKETLSTTCSNHFKIRRLQEQTTNNSVTVCPTQLESKRFHTMHKYRQCTDLIPRSVFLGSPRCTFPFLPLPCVITTEDVMHLGEGGGEKRKERVVIWCAYASLPLALSPLFWAPLLVNKQCLPLVSYHIISK